MLQYMLLCVMPGVGCDQGSSLCGMLRCDPAMCCGDVLPWQHSTALEHPAGTPHAGAKRCVCLMLGSRGYLWVQAALGSMEVFASEVVVAVQPLLFCAACRGAPRCGHWFRLPVVCSAAA
jgi:hypothetical protein